MYVGKMTKKVATCTRSCERYCEKNTNYLRIRGNFIWESPRQCHCLSGQWICRISWTIMRYVCYLFTDYLLILLVHLLASSKRSNKLCISITEISPLASSSSWLNSFRALSVDPPSLLVKHFSNSRCDTVPSPSRTYNYDYLSFN